MNIREHLERIRDSLDDATSEHLAQDDVCPCAMCRSFEDAVAALAQLKAAERPGLQDMYLGGSCHCDAPDGRSDCCTCDQGYALVPDPLVPRLDANPNTKEDA